MDKKREGQTGSPSSGPRASGLTAEREAAAAAALRWRPVVMRAKRSS